jgi:hypothetical protein
LLHHLRICDITIWPGDSRHRFLEADDHFAGSPAGIRVSSDRILVPDDRRAPTGDRIPEADQHAPVIDDDRCAQR